MKSATQLLLALTIALPLTAVRASAADPYAKTVVFAHILNGNVGNSYTDPTKALGASDGNYVSLGGPGASIILDMGADTPVVDGPGPDLEVREIGAAQQQGAADESYRVLVSNSTDTNTFVFVGVGRALSLIDIHSAGLASARYVWLQDLSTEISSLTPGSDIDSLRTLYYSGGGDVAPPSNVQVRLIGQGVWVSWTPSTATNVTGYTIRRSLDGVAFGSSADVTVSAQETAFYDPSLLVVSNYFYAVSALAGSAESTLVVASVPGLSLSLPLLTNQIVHLGDDTMPSWVDPSPQRDLTLSFTLPAFADGPEAELEMEVFDLDYPDAILVNGAKVNTLPSPTATESWVAKTKRLPAGALQPGLNTLTLSSRNSSGGTTGSLDDFQVRNLWLRLLSQTNLNLVTSARFTQIAAGQTNVTLRWVVEQTPSLTPVSWQTVSSPIEWTGTLTPTNGFFRLRDAP